MSEVASRYVDAIISDIFGEVVGSIANNLVTKGPSSLDMICKDIPLAKVTHSLQVLIQHNLVTFEKGSRGQAFYKFELLNAFSIMRYPKYLYIVKTELGDDAEVILEALLQFGRLSLVSVLYKAACKLLETNEDSLNVFVPMLKKKFDLLCEKKFIQRLPEVTVNAVPTFLDSSNIPFQKVVVDLGKLQDNVQTKTIPEESQGTDCVYWRVNISKFNECIRNQMIVDAVSRRIDEKAGVIMKIYLQNISEEYNTLNPVSGSVSVNTLIQALKKSNQEMSLSDLKDYNKLMEEDSARFITKIGEEGGGSYVINILNIVTEIIWSTIDWIVQEKYGSKAARIYRLIRSEGYVEQDLIQKKAMLLDKEAKLLTYTLLENSFLQLKEVRKSMANSGPFKNIYLFYINLPLTVRNLLELSYKSLANLINRNNDEINSNKRLLEKQQRTETILQNLKDQGATSEQLQEVEELISPAEKQILEHTQKSVHKLGLAELQVDENVFLFQTFLFYNQYPK